MCRWTDSIGSPTAILDSAHWTNYHRQWYDSVRPLQIDSAVVRTARPWLYARNIQFGRSVHAIFLSYDLAHQPALGASYRLTRRHPIHALLQSCLISMQDAGFETPLLGPSRFDAILGISRPFVASQLLQDKKGSPDRTLDALARACLRGPALKKDVSWPDREV